MREEAIFAGFGGQGVLSMGMMLAYAGMLEGKEVCWFPSYGPEMRGGTANCTVQVADGMISSPILSVYDTVVALNQPSVDKFEPKIKSGGTIIYDAANILTKPTREDIKIIGIAASDEALKLKNMKVMNMIVLGSFIKARNTVSPESVMDALYKALPERHHKLIPLNKEAFNVGMSLVD